MPGTGERWVVTDDGVRLFVEDTGSGEPLLLIQGLGYATWGWQKQVAVLSEHLRVIRFDNRGAGRSDKPDRPYSVDRLAEDAMCVLREIDAVPAHVLGFSMGGYVALALAVAHPRAVRSLVLNATSTGGLGAGGVPPETLAAWEAAADLSPEDFARRTMPLAFAPGWADAHPEDFERALAARLEYPTPAFAWRRQYAACQSFLAEGLAGRLPDVPVLVLHGTSDRIVPFGNAAPLAKRFPRSRLVPLEGAGHLACLERPDQYNRLVLDFTRQVKNGGVGNALHRN
jgi:3-oxoadipate enol-lactonase